MNRSFAGLLGVLAVCAACSGPGAEPGPGAGDSVADEPIAGSVVTIEPVTESSTDVADPPDDPTADSSVESTTDPGDDADAADPGDADDADADADDADDADDDPTQIVTRSPDAVGDGVRPGGLSTVSVRVTSVDGEVCEVCMWLADSSAERSTGLMGVTDLGGPVGMVFSWNAPTDGRFFMLGTPTPLSIAWFSESGEHVGQTDMAPCLTDDASTCERYGADAPYDLAIEMFEGQLGAVGIAPGARVELVAGSESPACPLAD